MKGKAKITGMTLIEVLTALAISALILTAVSSVFVRGIKQTRAISGDARLVESASHITNTLSLHVRPARTVELVSDTEIAITNQDYSISTLAFNGGEVQFNGVNILHDSATPTDVNFNVIGDTVQISFTLEANTGGSVEAATEPLSGTTTIAIRN
jgi:prepilin-type N-terminal cleavage/methylation domain-containing protein